MPDRSPIRRSLEIEEISNRYLIHPLSGRLALLFSKLGVAPNTVSVSGMLCGLLAGVAYYHYQDLRYAIAGFLLMVVWHILDGADGQLARLTHAQSQLGKILDGVCDYATFIAVYGALGVALGSSVGASVWIIIIAAAICHAMQAAAYEVQRQEYCFWGHDQKSAEIPGLDSLKTNASSAASASGVLHRAYAFYVRVQWRIAGLNLESRNTLAASVGAECDGCSIARQKYREIFAPAVRRWNILSSNYRTLGIFLAVTVGYPIAYFLFEIVVFSAIAAVLIARQPKLYGELFDHLISTRLETLRI